MVGRLNARYGILVERLWPRGLSKQDAKIDLWPKEVDPSTELQRWFNHDPGKWAEFKRRYFKELHSREGSLSPILERVGPGPVTFIFASRELRFNNAVGHCQVNSPRGTMPRCTLDDPATFDIAFRLTSSATLCGCTTDRA